MKKSLIPTLAAFLLFFGCKKNVEDNEPPADRPKYTHSYLDSNHYWGTWYPKNTSSRVSLDKKESHGGRYSVKISSDGDSNNYGTLFGRNFESNYFSGNRVRFSYWAKSRDITGEGTAAVFVFKPMDEIPTDKSENPFDVVRDFVKDNTGVDLENKKAKLNKYFYDHAGYLDSLPIKGTTDWKQYYLEVDVPSRTSYLRIVFGIEGKGSLWIDDVTYEKVKKLPSDSGYVDRSDYFTPLTGLDFEF